MDREGSLQVILGTVRSNKTAELMHRISIRRDYAHEDVLVFKPPEDKKGGDRTIGTRNSNGHQHLEAFVVPSKNPWAIFKVIRDEEQKIGKRIRCVAIDEGQFFKNLYPCVNALLVRGYHVVVAGLDLNFRGLPFGEMLSLSALVNAYPGSSMNWLISYCSCGERAFLSQRLINGEPAPFDSDVVMPGDSYEPRCRRCIVIPGSPFPK